MDNKFKNASGQHLLGSLFFEINTEDRSLVVYTLKDREHQGYPSLYLAYMAVADPTEYRFAIEHLDGWAHWEKIQGCSWFQEYIVKWRSELEIRMKSQSLARIMAVADKPSKEHFIANRYLLEGGWKTAQERKVGRTTKEHIKKEASRLASEAREVEAHALRLGLN